MSHTDPSDTLAMSKKLTDNGGSAPLQPKIFAQPFRLALKKGETDDVVWIEVRSLAGLRTVFERVEKGELAEIDRFSSLEMQLWGLMAEHAGFLRIRGSASQLAAGIQPLGEGPAALTEDLSFLTGGDDIAVLDILKNMKSTLNNVPTTQIVETEIPACDHSFVKEDGVNLTPEGEDALISLVLGPDPVAKRRGEDGKVSKQTIEFEKMSENAVEIFCRDTPPATKEEVLAEKTALTECPDLSNLTTQEVCKLNAVPPTEEPKVVGPEFSHAGQIGHQIDVAARGLDGEEDKRVRTETDLALQILQDMIDAGSLKELKRQTQDIFEQHGITMSELQKLATDANERAKERTGRIAPADSYAEALKNRERNFEKLMADLNEISLQSMVESSQPEPLTPEEREQQRRGPASMDVYRHEEIQADPSHGADHYKPREVTPASDTPMWRARTGLDHDPAEDWHKAQEDKDGDSSDD